MILAQDAATGAKPTVLAATDPTAQRNGYAGPSGFRELWGQPKWDCEINPRVFDSKLQDDLWEKCEQLTNADLKAKL